MKWSRYIVISLVIFGAAWIVFAQRDEVSRRFRGLEITSARPFDENATPIWSNAPDFTNDVFTFTRLQYTAQHDRYGRGHVEDDLRYLIDFPACDLDLSYRLQQMTSIKVEPDSAVVKMTDTNLFARPFIYLVEPGRGFLTDPEIPLLRKYLLNGGFMMVDDFWGDREWKAFEDEIERLFPPQQFPRQKITDLPLEHPIFHTVFDLKEQPQVPGLPWMKYYMSQGTTYEFKRGDTGYETVHYRGIHDDKGRLMVFICHNTDLGDGWEREADPDYFRIFSEPKAFPMGINAIVYSMTH
jgi:hypothetical protein